MVDYIARSRDMYEHHKSGEKLKAIALLYQLSVGRVQQIVAKEERKLTWRRVRGLPDDWQPSPEYLKEEHARLNPPPSALEQRRNYLGRRLVKLGGDLREIDDQRGRKAKAIHKVESELNSMPPPPPLLPDFMR